MPLGLTVPGYPVLAWLVWYNVFMGGVSVLAGTPWTRSEWSSSLSVSILAFHGIVFVGLVGMQQTGQTVAGKSVFAMTFRTFTWIADLFVCCGGREARQREVHGFR